MSKKYRVYRDGGSQSNANPTAMWFAQMGGTQEEIPMMQEQQQGEDPMAALFQQVAQALEQGADPAELVASLMQNQIPTETVMQIFMEIGMPQENVQQLVASVMQEMQQPEVAQQGTAPSDEEAMAMMQQEQAAQQAMPMGKYGYVKKRLKQAKEGMEQMSASDTNLAAYDNVTKNNLMEFNKDNELKMKFEQEYDNLNNYIDNPMMGAIPEARYGRGMERREARRERREDRRNARRARRDSRDINEAMQDAYGKIAFPSGVSPMMMPGSPVVGGSGVMDLEVRRGGLFNRIKDMRLHIEGMGMPANFSQGMFMNGMYNPYAFQNQGKITQKITYPGEITDNVNTPTEQVIKDVNNNNVPNNNDVNNGGTTSPTIDEIDLDMERMKRENEARLIDGVPEAGVYPGITPGAIPETGRDYFPTPGSQGSELDEVEQVNPNVTDVEGNDNLPYWVLAGTAAGVMGVNKLLKNYFRNKGLRDFRMVTPEMLRTVPKNLQGAAQQLLNAADPQKLLGSGTGQKLLTGTGQKLIGTTPSFGGTSIEGLSQTNKNAFRKIAKSGTAAEMRALAKQLGVTKMPGYSPKMGKKQIGNFIKSVFKFAMEDGGTVNMMDQNYGDPNLYKFTGGGDYDYFADGGYPQGMDVDDPYMPYMQGGGMSVTYMVETLMSNPPQFKVTDNKGMSHGIFSTREEANAKIIQLGGNPKRDIDPGFRKVNPSSIPIPVQKDMKGRTLYNTGGLIEGDEVYMDEADIAQFMAAGGSIEYM